MAATARLEAPDEVADRVMRRVQVSKMTRALQDRLALANVKIKNGWENLSLDVIEPQVEARLRRKRPASSNDTLSDTASTTSSRLHSSNGLASSPITEPMFSDDLYRSGNSLRNKRLRPSAAQNYASSGAATGRRNRATAGRSGTWKKAHCLPESSPIKPMRHARFPSNQVSHLSFISESSTIADDPPSPEFSEEDDGDIPITSFSISQPSRIATSPPHTPPPDRQKRQMRKIHEVSWSRTPKTGEEGADLLMYLATSPSPANAASRANTVIHAPTTPPCKSTPLPSSHMTPGTTGNGFLAFGPNTPSTNFNFADFVNVTPSPAQGPWTRTPIAGRTPGASARRRLDFDKLVPPTSSSPTITRSGRKEGSGMDLGGELPS